ncbi:MAG: DUF445 family protein [Candidatus Bipolaricaulia bacterium]
MPFQPWIWILLPLIGAVIGYITNWVAIRMLFRPLTEKRIFGVRVPFTPGVIPRQRARIIDNIGTTVSDHLVTQETVAARIERESVRERIGTIIGDSVSTWLNRDLGSIRSLIPETISDGWEEIIVRVQDRLETWIHELLVSDEITGLIQEVVDRRFKALLESRADALLSEEALERLPAHAGEFLETLLGNDRVEHKLREFLDERIVSLRSADGKLGDYLPESLTGLLESKLEVWFPEIVDRLVETVETEAVKDRIKLYLYEVMDRLFQESFNENSFWGQFKFGMMEAFVITAEELRAQIDRGVEEGVPHLANALREKQIQRKIYRAIVDAFHSLLDWNVGELFDDVADGTVDDLKERALSAMLKAARSRRLIEGAEGAITNWIADHRDRPIGEWLPESVDQMVRERATALLISSLQDQETANSIAESLKAPIDRWLDRPIGRLADRIPERYVIEGRELAAAKTIELLKAEVPGILEAIDIKGLVVENLQQFSTKEIEALVLDVTGNQLRAITWFGALLGLLIGLIQVGILLASR